MTSQNYIPSKAWLKLGKGYSDPVEPASFPELQLRFRNQKWAEKLGMSEFTDEQWVGHFAEFKPLADNLPEPLALRYHGHQFTHYNPELGDGRGFLFAQIIDPETERLLDLGTKGSGQTPYSRQGDGRLTLKGAVREALATAYLEYQGVNTSKTWSVVETGENLIRHDEPSPTRSAVLVRLSHSHVRFGTFQRLAYEQDAERIDQLVEYCLEFLYPEVNKKDFFQAVCQRVATTTAQWMIHGFVHGVLNTDNINITGESFDYGPYRFLPHYDPKFTAAYFDHQGLYAYGRQPNMILWNLERLKEALSVASSHDEIYKDEDFYKKGFESFSKVFNQQTYALFAKKIGVSSETAPEKLQNLFYLCLQFLEKSKAPYEAFFHHLYCWHQDLLRPLESYNPEFYKDDLIEQIQQELGQMQRDPNAKEKQAENFQTLLIDEIEQIWSAIEKSNNWTPFNKKLNALSSWAQRRT